MAWHLRKVREKKDENTRGEGRDLCGRRGNKANLQNAARKKKKKNSESSVVDPILTLLMRSFPVKNMFSSLRFTYCQYSVSALNGFNSLSLYKM